MIRNNTALAVLMAAGALLSCGKSNRTSAVAQVSPTSPSKMHVVDIEFVNGEYTYADNGTPTTNKTIVVHHLDKVQWTSSDNGVRVSYRNRPYVYNDTFEARGNAKDRDKFIATLPNHSPDDPYIEFDDSSTPQAVTPR